MKLLGKILLLLLATLSCIFLCMRECRKADITELYVEMKQRKFTIDNIDLNVMSAEFDSLFRKEMKDTLGYYCEIFDDCNLNFKELFNSLVTRSCDTVFCYYISDFESIYVEFYSAGSNMVYSYDGFEHAGWTETSQQKPLRIDFDNCFAEQLKYKYNYICDYDGEGAIRFIIGNKSITRIDVHLIWQ